MFISLLFCLSFLFFLCIRVAFCLETSLFNQKINWLVHHSFMLLVSLLSFGCRDIHLVSTFHLEKHSKPQDFLWMFHWTSLFLLAIVYTHTSSLSLLLPLFFCLFPSLVNALLSGTLFSPRLPHLYRMLREQEAVTCDINKRGKKMGHIMWRYSTEKVIVPANVALEAPPVWCARTENSDLVQQWHVYGWWAQASDFACRDWNLAPGPSHLEHLGLKPFQETRHASCWVEAKYSSYMPACLCLLLLSLRICLFLYLSYSFSHASGNVSLSGRSVNHFGLDWNIWTTASLIFMKWIQLTEHLVLRGRISNLVILQFVL